MAGAASNDPQRDVRSDMRASDADRERIASVLRRAVDEGRLDLAEYDERLRNLYEAKTYGELAPLTRDLPAPPPRPMPATTSPAPPPPPPYGRRLPPHWRSWASVSAIVVGIWLFSSVSSGTLHDFWPIWVIGPWGILVALRSFGSPGGSDRRHRRVRC